MTNNLNTANQEVDSTPMPDLNVVNSTPVDMILNFSPDGKKVTVVPSRSKSSKGDFLNAFSKKRDEKESQESGVQSTLQKYFGAEFFEPSSIQPLGKIKLKNRQFNLFVMTMGTSLPEGAINISVDKIKPGKTIPLNVDGKVKNFKSRRVLIEAVKLHRIIPKQT